MNCAWFDGDEMVFDYTFMNFPTTENAGSSGSAFDKNDYNRKWFRQWTKKDEGVGIIFLDEHSTDCHPSALLNMLATCSFVSSDIKHIVIANARRVGKMDLARKMRSFNSKNKILADFIEHDEHAIYTEEDFELAGGRWTVHRVPDANLDERIRLGFSALNKLSQILKFANLCLGTDQKPLEWLREYKSIVLPLADLGEREKTAKACAKRLMFFISRPQRTLEMLSFSALSSPYIDTTREDLEKLLDTMSILASGGGRIRVKQWRGWEDAETFDCFDWTVDDEESVDLHARALCDQVSDINHIWQKTLSNQKSFLHLPGSFDKNFSSKDQIELAFASVRALGEVYGVDSCVDAYLHGVPMEDIFA